MKYYVLFFFVLFLCACTENENNSSCSVSVQLLSPANEVTLPFEEMEVVLTNKDQGTVYTSSCSSDGVARFNVEYGYYTVAVHYQSASGVIFSGRLESLSLLPEQGDEVMKVQLQLARSKINALVIKEIYYVGCKDKLGAYYQADQYVTLYNNSDETIYLDGLCLALVDPMPGIVSPWVEYTDMKRIPVADMTWQFPGSGKEYPLLPGAETTIATNAVDHTGGEYQHANSVDLSKADWGFWHVSLSKQNIAPGVKPMNLLLNLNPTAWMYSFPVVGPTFMIFGFEGISAEEYVNNPLNRENRPQASNKTKFYLMIPKEWVIDCVECVENEAKLTNKRVPDELNHDPGYIPEGDYSGKSLIRKSTVSTNGHFIYQDTNNAADDFIVSEPSLKK